MAPLWKEQRKRVERWLERVRRMHAGTTINDMSTKELEDDARAFFIECSHLGDYFHKSSPPLCSRSEVRAWRKSHPVLETCRELCNGLKHVIDASPSIRKTAILVQINDVGGGEPEPTGHGVRMVVDPGAADALQLAEQAVAAWDELIAASNKSSGVKP